MSSKRLEVGTTHFILAKKRCLWGRLWVGSNKNWQRREASEGVYGWGATKIVFIPLYPWESHIPLAVHSPAQPSHGGKNRHIRSFPLCLYYIIAVRWASKSLSRLNSSSKIGSYNAYPHHPHLLVCQLFDVRFRERNLLANPSKGRRSRQKKNEERERERARQHGNQERRE